MARRYLTARSVRGDFRPEIELTAADRLRLARALAEVAVRAGGRSPLAGSRQIVEVLTGLAASAAGDGPLQVATGDLDERQRATLGNVLAAAVSRAAGDHDPDGHLIAAVEREWRRHARLPELAAS